MIAALLCVLGVAAYAFSTVTAGGGSMLLVPVLNGLIGTPATAPVLNLGAMIGRPARIILFWKYIHWPVCVYYIPAAMIGAWLGSFLFSSVKVQWLQIFVGLFLISTVFQFRFGKQARSFAMKLSYFAPLGFFVSIFGTLIGAVGPVLNPFYLNQGLEKEDLIATKAANSFFMGLSQIGSYAVFGLLTPTLWVYGGALGVGALFGNIIGKRVLAGTKSQTFRTLMIAVMALSGFLMIVRALFN